MVAERERELIGSSDQAFQTLIAQYVTLRNAIASVGTLPNDLL